VSELVRWLLHLPEAASSFASGIDTLHAIIIGITLAGAVGMTGLTVAFVIRHDENGGSRGTAPRGVPRRLEYGVIAGLLVMFLGFWVVGYRQYVAMATPPDDTFDVYVIGKQWMWSFAYADGGASNHDLYVPRGKPVRLLLTSRDVIHSFFVPAMRIKQDAVPGRMTVAWFEAIREGEYEVLCAEFCGLSHSRMRGRVVVLSPERYEALRRAQYDPPGGEQLGRGLMVESNRSATSSARAQLTSMSERGRDVAAERGCLRCHTLDGTPHLGPSWAGLYMSNIPLDDGQTVVADPAYLTRAMMDPTAEVHAGYSAIMPSYAGLLDAPEVAALVELMRRLRDVAPADGPPVPLPAKADRPPTLPGQ
jgi:cytochrome c oxidase subunit 2